MFLEVKIPDGLIKEHKIVYTNTGRELEFPLLSIDKGSYLVQGQIVSGLGFNWDGGVHSIQIGKYSAISQQILFMVNPNHDYKGVFQGEIEGLKVTTPKVRQKGQIIIGSDCWIGHGATIMSGVTIHDGAIVAANSTVTKDVLPYEIVGGNPARHIKYRFDEDIIQKLSAIRWWNWSHEEILRQSAYMTGDVESFCEHFYEMLPLQKNDSGFNRISDGDAYFFVLDLNENYPLYKKVISAFIDKFDHTNTELILFFENNQENGQENYNTLMDFLDQYDEAEVFVNLFAGSLEDIPEILDHSSHYITGHLHCNVETVMTGYLKGVKCISGIDIPVF